MTVSPKLKSIIESHDEDLDTQKYDKIVQDAIREDVLDELLDAFYRIDITIPPEIVTKQLYEFDIKRVLQTEEDRAGYMRKIKYLINKHQNVIVKTLDAPKK